MVERWVESPYWHHFCGEEYFRHEMPINLIGHMKSDGRLGKNFLKGVAMNALLWGAGHNLRKILRRLALLCARFGVSLLSVDGWQNASLQPDG